MPNTFIQLDVETEFDLMVKYQRTIESNAVLIEHSLEDKFQYGLYELQKPLPTYDEYLHGNDFIEGELIEESSDIVRLEVLQDMRRKEKAPSNNTRGF